MRSPGRSRAIRRTARATGAASQSLDIYRPPLPPGTDPDRRQAEVQRGGSLTIERVTEADADGDLAGDRTEDRTNLRAGLTQRPLSRGHREYAITIENAGPRVADLPAGGAALLPAHRQRPVRDGMPEAARVRGSRRRGEPERSAVRAGAAGRRRAADGDVRDRRPGIDGRVRQRKGRGRGSRRRRRVRRRGGQAKAPAAAASGQPAAQRQRDAPSTCTRAAPGRSRFA